MVFSSRIAALVVAFLTVTALLVPSSAGANAAANESPVVFLQGHFSQTCAMHQNGTVSCWGSGGSDVPFSVSGVTNAASLTVGLDLSCAVLVTGAVKCWGNNSSGGLGNGTTSAVPQGTAVAVQGITNATTVSVGYLGACALLEDGGAKCWGLNNFGQLGNGTTANSSVPVQVQGITNAMTIATNSQHSCALLQTGGTKCWGRGDSGQLGNGTFNNSTIPVDVQDITAATALAMGSTNTCAILQTGSIQCWGSNRYGQLGAGSPNNYSAVPLPVYGITNAAEIARGGLSSPCALLQTGSIKCWGRGLHGELGNGTYNSSTIPVDVQGITTATAIDDGTSDTPCALLESGSVMCWGYNGYGGLGNGTTTSSPVPVEVLHLANVSALSAVGQTTCALQQTGRVKCWGRGYTALGDGGTQNSPIPVPALIGVGARFAAGSATATTGWIIIDNVKGHVDAACRAELEALGRTFPVANWSELSAIPQRVTQIPCEILIELPTDDTTEPEPPQPEGPLSLVTNSATNTAGWVIANNTRQWLSPTCRTQLEAAGATFTITTWADISSTPNTTNPQTCNILETQLDEPETGATSLVTNSATNTAGWVIANNTRQWLSPTCRTQLEAAGATFTITTWADISSTPNTTNPQTCNTLENQLYRSTPPVDNGALYETTVNNNGGFWVVGTERKWLSDACMSQLRGAGATVTAVPWTQIAPTTDNPDLTTCDELLANI